MSTNYRDCSKRQMFQNWKKSHQGQSILSILRRQQCNLDPITLKPLLNTFHVHHIIPLSLLSQAQTPLITHISNLMLINADTNLKLGNHVSGIYRVFLPNVSGTIHYAKDISKVMKSVYQHPTIIEILEVHYIPLIESIDDKISYWIERLGPSIHSPKLSLPLSSYGLL